MQANINLKIIKSFFMGVVFIQNKMLSPVLLLND